MEQINILAQHHYNLAIEFKIDLDKQRADYFSNISIISGQNIIENLAYLMIPLAKLANTTRHKELPPEFTISLVKFMLVIEKICDIHNIPLFENINKKIQINQEKNHQNRIK